MVTGNRVAYLNCQQTGYGGEVKQGHDSTKVATMKPVRNRVIRVRFNADTASSMQWNFKPQQAEIKVCTSILAHTCV